MRHTSRKTVDVGSLYTSFYIPRVLKLSKHKFACYVERYTGQLPAWELAVTNVKIVSKRTRARRVAAAMARRIDHAAPVPALPERPD